MYETNIEKISIQQIENATLHAMVLNNIRTIKYKVKLQGTREIPALPVGF